MKKKLVMVMLLLLATVMILSACGDKATEGLEYTARNGGYYVTGYHGTDVNVVIPDTYNDVPVTGIAEEAFAESDIQTVEVGGNVEIIEQAAFYRASLLREVHLPASLLCTFLHLPVCLQLQAIHALYELPPVSVLLFLSLFW